MKIQLTLAVVLLFWACVPSLGDEVGKATNADANVPFFEQHIRPVLIQRCVQCHGAEKQQGQLRLDTEAALRKGGESGTAIEPGNVEDSLLLSAIRHESLEMPPDGRLSEREISAFEKWVASGAKWPAGATLETAESARREITEQDREHWSFLPVEDPQVPVCGDGQPADWCKNPIDHFVLRRLTAEQMTPAPQADRRTLLRRLYFNVIGLPPTPEELNRFLQDESLLAVESAVDDLLNRPGFGERWARHWLDLVRYGESDGYRADGYRSGAWHYRDYVVRSLNEDKPYDRFVAEQLAGDELFPGDPDSWVGTGYLRLPIYEYNQRDVVTQRNDILNDITDVTADVFLGLGLKCARCHDHKFDPLLQTDYYRLQAHFAALLPRDDALLIDPDRQRQYEQQLQQWEAATTEIRDRIAELEKPAREKQAAVVLAKFTPEILAMYHKSPDERTPYEQQLVYFVDRQTTEEGSSKPSKSAAEQIEKLKKQLASFDHLKPALPHRTLSVQDTGRIAPPTEIVKGSRSEVVEPAAIEVVRHLVPTVPASPGRDSTGRRAALASWIASPQNPLTARVAVNRIWQQYFGRGLVATSSDFGRLGEEPSHPELLDWLASYLTKHGWRLKSIHRLILTSATYQQSAFHPQAAQYQQIDPANTLRWHANVRRLDAEQIVDAASSVAGQLDATVGGPSVGSGDRRRAVYRKVRRNKPDSLLHLFDATDGINSVPKRSVTTTAPQALALLNGKFGQQRAREMADRVAGHATTTSEIVRHAYELAFARLPSEFELEMAIEYLGSSETEMPSNSLLTDFCHVLLNANEFVYVD